MFFNRSLPKNNKKATAQRTDNGLRYFVKPTLPRLHPMTIMNMPTASNLGLMENINTALCLLNTNYRCQRKLGWAPRSSPIFRTLTVTPVSLHIWGMILGIFMCHHKLFHSVIIEEKGLKWKVTPIYLPFFQHFTRRKGSSYLHELYLSPTICLLNLTFMGPSWRLWPIPIHSESIDQHWKHPSGFDFSASQSPLSNPYTLWSNH